MYMIAQKSIFGYSHLELTRGGYYQGFEPKKFRVLLFICLLSPVFHTFLVNGGVCCFIRLLCYPGLANDFFIDFLCIRTYHNSVNVQPGEDELADP